MHREPFAARLANLRRLMAEHDLDAFMVASPENRYYLSGFEASDLHCTESSGYLLVTASGQYLFTDFRYVEEAKAEAPDFSLLVYQDGAKNILPDLFATLATSRLGLEGHYLPYQVYHDVKNALRASRPEATTVAVEGFIEELRVVKEPGEIERIRASLAITEAVMEAMFQTLSPGRTEKDAAWEVERRMRELGAESVSFPPIVAAGENGALPHAVPTDRLIRAGEPVVVDIGARLALYCSDMTRTWISGAPPQAIREIYSVVREAQAAAITALRPGLEGREVDKVARDFITKAGYGERFGHGLGHGVGIAVHERPGLRRTSDAVLRENMVVTVEPGIYLPGVGGVRLENMVRVTATGCEVMNKSGLFYEGW